MRLKEYCNQCWFGIEGLRTVYDDLRMLRRLDGTVDVHMEFCSKRDTTPACETIHVAKL